MSIATFSGLPEIGEQKGSSILNYGLKVSATATPGSQARVSQKSSGEVHLTQTYAAANPLVNLSPDIDVHHKSTIIAQPNKESGYSINISGTLSGDAFPNAEILITDRAGQSLLLHTFSTSASPVTGPYSMLPGDQRREMGSYNVTLTVDTSGNFSSVIDRSGSTYSIQHWNSKMATSGGEHTKDIPTQMDEFIRATEAGPGWYRFGGGP
jgi:hypothetical protein